MRLSRGQLWFLLLATVAATIYGGGKSGRVIVSDPYIEDAGSWLSPSNGLAYVAIAKRTPLLPDDAEILVYAREVASTNAADWARLSPHLTFAEHPFRYSLPGLATNYDVMVAANYAPAPIVHTNGVWSIPGFLIPGGGGKAAFKGARVNTTEQGQP